MGEYQVNEGKVFEALPENRYQVEVYAAVPFMGTEFGTSNPQKQVKFTLVVLDDDKTVPEEGKQVPVRGRRLWLQTTTNFSPVKSKKPSNLTLLTAAIFGHRLEPEEVAVFSEQDLLCKQLCVMVGQKERQDGSIGNKILSFSPAEKELPKWDDGEFAERRAKEKVGSFEQEMDELAAGKKKK